MRPRLPLLAGVALALAGAAPAAAAPAALYGGHTSEDAPITLQVSADGRTLRQLAFYVDTACDDGTTSDWTGVASFSAFKPATIALGKNVFSPARVSRRGSFRTTGLEQDAYDGGHVGTTTETLRGSIRGGVGHGTFSARTEIVDAGGAKVATCAGRTVRWEAHSAPGRTYAGLTSDGLPVVVQRNRDGRRVDHVWMAWEAPCQSDGFFAFGESFVNFPVSRSGRFGNAFDDPVTLDGGGARTYAYSLHGQLGSQRASGTFQVVVTDKDAGGATTDTCDSTLQRWSVRSTKGKAPKGRPGEIRRVGA
jgi:hypothetical protein